MLKGIGNLLKSRSSIYLLAGFYILAGINHFINPGFYYPLIPDYLPNHQLINMLSGISEVVFGIGIAFRQYQKICIRANHADADSFYSLACVFYCVRQLRRRWFVLTSYYWLVEITNHSPHTYLLGLGCW